MPSRPKKPCNYPGCKELVNKGYCDKHRKQEYGRYNREGRPDSHRYYGTMAWKRLRAMQLETEPLCRACREQGRLVPATVADHIVDRDDGGEDSLDNLQSLCASCHSKKTLKQRQ